MSAWSRLANLLRTAVGGTSGAAAKYIDDRFAALEGTATAAPTSGPAANAIADKTAGALAPTDLATPYVLLLDVRAGTTGNLDFTALPFKARVIDVYARKVTTSADAGDTGALQNASGTAISSTLALNIAAGAIARTTSLNAATHEIAANGTLRWRRTQATNAACVVVVTLVRVS